MASRKQRPKPPAAPEPPPGDTDPKDEDPREVEPDAVWIVTRTRRESEITGDTGETDDGLDDTEEAVRRKAEDFPTGRRRKLP